MKALKAIAAMAENRVIGQGNRLPWRLPEDLKWFKEMTSGQIVVMGRKTFESLPKPLPNRHTIVLSRSGFVFPGVEVCSELDLDRLAKDPRDVFICGGAEIYRAWLPLCSDLFLTRVRQVIKGDAFFPPFEDQFELVKVVISCDAFQIEHHRRKTAPWPGGAHPDTAPKTRVRQINGNRQARTGPGS